MGPQINTEKALNTFILLLVILRLDRGIQSLYIILGKEVLEAELLEIAPGINMELDEAGQLIGVEVFRASFLFFLCLNIVHSTNAFKVCVLSPY